MKSVIRGELVSFDCEQSCNDSLRPQHWVRDGGFGSTAHLLGDMGQVASPLQAPAASSALLLGGVTIK